MAYNMEKLKVEIEPQKWSLYTGIDANQYYIGALDKSEYWNLINAAEHDLLPEMRADLQKQGTDFSKNDFFLFLSKSGQPLARLPIIMRPEFKRHIDYLFSMFMENGEKLTVEDFTTEHRELQSVKSSFAKNMERIGIQAPTPDNKSGSDIHVRTNYYSSGYSSYGDSTTHKVIF
jgi:hypothetical protein